MNARYCGATLLDLRKKNPKVFWNYINSKRKGRSDIGDFKSYNIHGNKVLITSNEDKANALGQFFSSIFTNEIQTTYDTQAVSYTHLTLPTILRV